MTSSLRRFARVSPVLLAVSLVATLGSGCVTEEVKKVTPPTMTIRSGPRESVSGDPLAAPSKRPAKAGESSSDESTTAKPNEPVKPVDANLATNADPCASNMQNLSGALLMYYATNQQLPAKLADVSAMSDPLSPFEFRCPKSKLAYVYNPAGLRAEGKSKVIVLYDAADSHNGVRWCILVSASKTVANLSMEVVAMPESSFRLYH